MDVVERSLEVARPVEAVWELLATPRALGAWLGGAMDLEIRPGAKGTFRPDGDGPTRWVTIGVVDPPRELRLVWWYDGGDRGLVTVRVDEVDGGAVVHVREQRVGNRLLLGLRASA
jgi:uncharacterized protein YndB with AHSA1/START domain